MSFRKNPDPTRRAGSGPVKNLLLTVLKYHKGQKRLLYRYTKVPGSTSIATVLNAKHRSRVQLLKVPRFRPDKKLDDGKCSISRDLCESHVSGADPTRLVDVRFHGK